MVRYDYYIVESSFVARIGPGTTERLTRDGVWEDYPDRWDVLTNGRLLESEEKALATAKQLFQRKSLKSGWMPNEIMKEDPDDRR